MIGVTIFILVVFILVLATLILRGSDQSLKSLVIMLPIASVVSLTALLIYLNANIFSDPPIDPDQLISSIEQELKEQLRTQPLNESLYRGLIEVLIQSQRYDEASEIALQFKDNIQNLTLSDQLLIAESFILIDQNELIKEDVQNLLLAVHSNDDLNIKALWYLGLSYLLIGDSASAEVYWSRLIMLSPPDPLNSFILSQLEQLRSDVTLSSSFDINVRALLVQRLNDNLSAFNQYSRVYVIAKNLDQPIPFAVSQYNAYSPDQTYHIDRSNIMIASNQSDLQESLLLEVRISFSGDPIARAGDLFGQLVIDTQNITGSALEPFIINIDKSY